MSAAAGVFRLVVRLMPAWFRERYEEEMLETFGARCGRAAGTGERLRLLAGELPGALWLLVRLRLGLIRRDSVGLERGRAGGTDGLLQDVRFALRGLGRNPGYTAGALLVLAVGIGANTAMFSAVNAFLFRPLPFTEEDRVVVLYETNPEFEWTDAEAAPANVLDWRERVSSFEDVAAYSERVSRVPYMLNGEPVLVTSSAVTGNFFSVLGVRAALGRTFTWEETWAGQSDVVVLSDAVWRTHFGADRGIVGRTVTLGSSELRVVGVMPPGFSFPNSETQLWTTWAWPVENREQVFFRRAHWVRPVARLAAGVTHEQANAELQSVVQQLQVEYPETNRIMGAGMMPARDFFVRDVRTPLFILLGAVALLLLLSCANVANLTLVRAAERSREVAVRHALGAGRGRIARLMLTESIVLALVGGALGLGVGWAGVRMLQRLAPLGIDGATSIALDARVLLFTAGAAALSGLLFGLVPAVRTVRRDIFGALVEEGRSGTRGRSGARTANLLVAAEVALALLLVVGAGLMIQSFLRIREVDPGFRRDGVIAVQISAPSSRYGDRDQVVSFYDRLAESLEARPGIERVGTVGELPLNGASWSSQFTARGWPPERVGVEILHRRTDRGYFEALDIPLVRGRLFGPADGSDTPPVVVVNETFVREHFPDEDPIGQQITYERVPTEQSIWYEIIGVVGDQQQVSPTQPARAEVFEHRRFDWARTSWVVVRAAGSAEAALPVIRDALREVDPLIPLAQTRTLDDVWSKSTSREQFILTLLTIFGSAALLLASVGVYAVTAQAARNRTREIGIRMALGAAAPSVQALMLRQSMGVVAGGIVCGLAFSMIATRALASVLFDVAPTDPLTLGAVSALLAVVAGFACYIPARRATAVDPAGVLKDG